MQTGILKITDNKEKIYMASINGISIKKLKHFEDHEGCKISQGELYYNGKHLGSWSQDAWNGPDRFDFGIKKLLESEVESYKKSGLVTEEYRSIFDIDILMYELVNLMDDEKNYKKGIKRGHTAYIVASDGCHVRGYWDTGSKEKIVNDPYHKKFLADCKKAFIKNWDGKVRIYTCDDDFIIRT